MVLRSGMGVCPEKHPKTIQRICRPQSQAASPTGVNSSHGEAIKAHKPVRGNVATGSHQVLPGGLARKCPVDSFAEAAISKEYLSAEGSPAPVSGRASEC
ncbi:hypothetical protein [Desulfosporosinus youngiae]|uniref:hypothetical protein n=1 Tax=Desulfosporosinus youngiae TaxID=339862 RepID=UPI00031D55CB|nr:hypothetical protein [Desulfosporosinus youngiae]